ncbi:MAG: FecR domain-containing protein [Pseudobacter sp.]|uniref:FecR domain-containing protein n=1 Tax=Pseudobacter sp. TaxID=2045420 RepID=UPI003F816FCE
MSQHPNHQMDDQLLAKYLSGDATPEEAIQVNDWLRLPGNMEQFRQSAYIWAQMEGDPVHQLPDQNNSWQNIKLAMQAPVSIPLQPGKHNRWRFAIAASVLVVMLSGIYFLFFQPTQRIADYEVKKNTLTAENRVLRDTLPDGSRVVLNSFSAIEYSLDFPKSGRNLGLHGEAWFDITPGPSDPFTIFAGDVTVKVLGTSFNVRETPDSVLVTLQSGSVRMCRDRDSITLQPGELGIYDIRNRHFEIIRSADPNQTGYATRIFDFKDESLREIASQIEKAYDIKIVFNNQALADCTMSSTFNNESLDYIMNVIAVTLNITFRTENKTVYLSGKSCE